MATTNPLTDLSSYYDQPDDSTGYSKAGQPKSPIFGKNSPMSMAMNYYNSQNQMPAMSAPVRPTATTDPDFIPSMGAMPPAPGQSPIQGYPQQSYAHGGATHGGSATDITKTANGIASLGRKNDSMLVHMSPVEYRTLATLGQQHGIQLTKNPVTGLPELFALDKLLSAALPAIVGAGVAVATGGTGLAAYAPLMAGLGAGGVKYAQTGDLNQGLMTGMLAGAGAGVGGDLMGSGADAATVTPTPPPNVGEMSSAVNPTDIPPPASQAPTTAPAATNAAATNAAAQKAAQEATQAQLSNMTFGEKVGALGEGASSPEAWGKALTTKSGAALGVGALGTMMNTGAAGPQAASLYPSYYSGAGHYNRRMRAAPTGYDLTKQGEWNYFPDGGMYQAAASGGATKDIADRPPVTQEASDQGIAAYDQGTDTSILRQLRRAYPTRADAEEAANHQGSLAQRLGVTAANSQILDYAYGAKQHLSGDGDGMSDDIDATINNTEPAKLADGEFVIPADVVSGLGNGSSKAGIKQLYTMLDRVREARTGTTKQGKQIDAEKFLPV